jgi:hypothetical protein
MSHVVGLRALESDARMGGPPEVEALCERVRAVLVSDEGGRSQ